MGLESATYISELNSSNPLTTDNISQGDDHIRLIKSTLAATFSGFAGAAIAATEAQIDAACIPKYSSMEEAAAQAVTSTSWATASVTAGFTEGQTSGITNNVADAIMTIDTTGKYFVVVSCRAALSGGATSGDVGVSYEGADPALPLTQKINQDSTCTFSGIVACSATDTLGLEAKTDAGTMTLDDITFTAIRISG